MKKITASLFFIFITICLQAQNLSWDIKFLQGKNRESVPISRPVRMETGDNFLISIKPAIDCYCYVVCYDSDQRISVLENKFIEGGIDIRLGPIDITAPSGNEMLYVIISLERQTMLESLIKTYNSNPNLQQNANNLYREVVNLQNTASGLGEPASSFIPSGGTSRGGTEEYATRFSEKNMYVRPIIIRH